MKPVPVIPTILVTLAVAAMIGLGLWQLLDRLPQKRVFLAQLAANPGKPPIAFPRFPDDLLLFRRATGFCLQPTNIRITGAGAAGFRLIANCRTGAEGPGMAVQLGTTRDPGKTIVWKGGEVGGFISHAPDSQSLIGSLFAHHRQQLMLVLGAPPPGLEANKRPGIEAVPNNHFAYGVQWFLFAGIATAIYGLALWQRAKKG